LFILILNYIKAQENLLDDGIYPNVFIDNVNMGWKPKTQAVGEINKKYDYLKKINISIKYDREIIATYSAQKAQLKTDVEEVADRAYLIGRMEYILPRLQQRFLTIFKLKKYNFETTIKYDKNLFKDFIEIKEQTYNKPAKNALFKFENNRVVEFRKEENGLKLNSEKFLNDIDVAIYKLKNNSKNISIKLESKIIKPEITLSKANNFGIEELIGSGKSNFSHSIPERVHNISIATSKFNGVLIPPNKMFSFNKTVGDISASTGYKPAYIIKSGKTVLGDGGGVCQVSSTVFRAALNSGLPILERSAHAYRVSYYEQDSKPGFDATVFAPSVDLKFRNDTNNYILIQTEIDYINNILVFNFYGKKDYRTVEISPVLVYDVQPPLPDSFQDDPTLRRGITKQVDFPAWGAKAEFFYKVKKNNQIIFEKKFYSSYKPWAAVFLVGTGDF
jgi:vancomycin resistance protein YoaR